MGRLGNINNYVAAQSDAKKQEVNQQYDQQQQTQQQPVQQQPPQAPISQPSIAAATNSNPMAGAEQVNFREKTLQNLDENDFKERQKELNASDKEYWGAKLKQNPESSYSILREYFASDETPEEKAKRERRDALGETFRNLGNVIGNAANLYYAHRGGTPIDLNTANEKHNERIRQLKEKQDAIQRQREQMFLNAKINDIKSERAKADKKEEREYNAQQQAERYRREDAIRAQNQKNLDRDYEFRVKQDERNAQKQEEERAYKRRQDELNNNFRWAQLNWQKEKNNSTNSGTKNSKLAVVDTPKGTMNVDFGRINERTYEQLYQKANKVFSEMSEDERKKFNLPVIGVSDSKEDRQKKMGEIVSAAILNIPGYSDWFETAGVGAYQQQKPVETSASNQEGEKPFDISQYEVIDFSENERPVEKKSSTPTNKSITVDTIKEAIAKEEGKRKDILARGKDFLDKDKTRYNVYPSDTFR